MKKKTEKALRNLKIGGVFTPIAFGLFLILANPVFDFVDPSGALSEKFNSAPFFSPAPTALGCVVLFLGINTYAYFVRYTNSLKSE